MISSLLRGEAKNNVFLKRGTGMGILIMQKELNAALRNKFLTPKMPTRAMHFKSVRNPDLN